MNYNAIISSSGAAEVTFLKLDLISSNFYFIYFSFDLSLNLYALVNVLPK